MTRRAGGMSSTSSRPPRKRSNDGASAPPSQGDGLAVGAVPAYVSTSLSLVESTTLKEAHRLIRVAEGHEKRVELRERSARFLDERGEAEGASHERREAERERDAARDAWDRSMALQGPTQMTEPKSGKPLEIPIPARADFMRNLEHVAPNPAPVEHDSGPRSGAPLAGK